MRYVLQPFDRNSRPYWQGVVNLVVLLIAGIIAANAVGTLIDGALGNALTTQAGKYSLLLYGDLMLVTVAFAAAYYGRQSIQPIARLISHVISGVIVGFYYGGTGLSSITTLSTTQQASWAIAGAIGGGVICGVANFARAAWCQIALSSLRTVVLYGTAFLSGGIGCMFLNVGQGVGFLFIGVLFGALDVTLRSISDTVKYLKQQIQAGSI
jgi:hypothetical protein